MSNIILIGMRGTGKSALGKKLAEKLGWKFIDADTCIVQEAGKEIKDIVEEKGWEYFRSLEKKIITDISCKDKYVIATGGGAIMDDENVKNLKRNNIVVLLTTDLNLIAERIGRHDRRPSLTGKLSATEEVEKIWKERKDRYFSTANITFDTSRTSRNKEANLKQKAKDLIRLLKKFGI